MQIEELDPGAKVTWRTVAAISVPIALIVIISLAICMKFWWLKRQISGWSMRLKLLRKGRFHLFKLSKRRETGKGIELGVV
jgi:hypothetical protein